MTTRPSAESSFTLQRVQQMLGISRAAVTALIAAGFVSPTRGARNAYRFTFQDLMLLRTAHALRQARIPTRKILRALRRLKASLPDELPITGLRITALADHVVVRDARGPWDADSGQLLIDFEVASSQGAVAFIEPRARAAEDRPDDYRTIFDRGAELEAADPARAEAAYRRAIALEPGTVDAYLNLGAMLCEAGRCGDAIELYEQALRHCPDSALLHFNHAIALEDGGRTAAAVAAYERSLTLDPTLADAHFNLGRLQEELGDARKALRHFSAFRRLQT